MSVILDPVESQSALKEFIRLPAELYKKLPRYTAPLTMERRDLLDPGKAPFFKHGEAKYWIARVGGNAVGRISAQIDQAQPAGTFDDAGLFGCLDAADDPDIVRALIECAEGWLRSKGRSRALGPCTLSMNGEPGLLVEGYDEPALIMVPWHPPYLASHLESCGYAKSCDLHYWRRRSKTETTSDLKLPEQLQPDRTGFSVRSLDMKNLAGEIDIVRQVYNDAWQDNWGFVPIMPEDVASIASDLKPFMRPEYGLIVEKKGRPVGVAILLPNLFEITGDLGADPSPLGWAKLAYRTFFHRFRSGRIILLGVRSEFRDSVGGALIAMTMVDKLSSFLLNFQYETDWIEAGWVLENNHALNKILNQFGFQRVRTLRLYDKSFSED